MAVKIITDSACDLPEEILQEYGIDRVPIPVYQDETEFLDGVTLKPLELLAEMRNGKVYRTSQIPPQVYLNKFDSYAREGASCIYLAFSSKLSGIYQSAMMAFNETKETYADFDLDIVDTKCASLGFGLVVYKAAQLAKAGKSKDEILQAVEFYARHMEHIFTVDDLEYLYRGGRVSRAAAIIGGILDVKPILNVEDGKLIPFEKVRGRKRVLKKMVEVIGERGRDLANQTIGISHGDDMEVVNQLMEMLKAEFGCKDFLINLIGSAVGAHSGPGTLAVFFLNEKAPC